MPSRVLPDEGTTEFEELKKAVETQPKDELEVTARTHGFSNAASLMTSMARYGIKRSNVEKAAPEAYVVPPAEEIAADVELTRAKAEVKHYKGLYQGAVKQLGKQEIIVEAIWDASKMIPKITVATPTPREHLMIEDRGSETDVLQLSDLHAGEVVSLEETMGINSYNMQIMNRRVSLAFRKTLELVELRRSALHIPKLIIAEEGDMLSGEIHAELVRTNVGHMMNLCTRTAFIIAQGIHYLAPHFANIEVVGVVGNHPRLYQKPHYKEKYINWDYLCYQWQAVFCKDLLNVHFTIPKSPYILVNAEETSILMMHGDGIKSWMGIPWYGIDRAIFRLREMLQASGEYFDAALLAHFHCRGDLDKATGPVIINGSVKGGDEFSMGSMQTSHAPSQNLLYFHDRHGYLGGGPIYLADADEKEGIEFKDHLPEVWADLSEEIKENL